MLREVFARGLIDRGAAGAIVNLSSEAGKCAFPGHSVYCTSKAAIDHLTRCMAYELGPHKVGFLFVTRTWNSQVIPRRIAGPHLSTPEGCKAELA